MDTRVKKSYLKKYFSGEELEFNDLMNLDSLYKSNFEKFSKKDDDDE